MKRTLLAMFLVLVALVSVGSASAADEYKCSTLGTGLGSDLEITNLEFDPDEAYEPNDDVEVEIKVENEGSYDITIQDNSDMELFVYKDDDELISTDYGMPLAFDVVGDVTVSANGGKATIKATWNVKPIDYYAYMYDNDHDYTLYLRVQGDDSQIIPVTHCVESSGNTIVLDRYPNLMGISSKTAIEDTVFTYQASASDDDNDPDDVPIDILTFSLDTAPSGMSIVPSTGAISWTPRNEHVGSNAIVVKASDGYGGYDTESFQITVANTNDAPVLSTVSSDRVQEGIVMDPITLPEAQDVDVGDVVSYSLSIVSTDATTFDVLSYFDASTRVISGWLPARSDVGELQLKLTATDLLGAKDDQVFTVDIYPKVMCEEGESGNALDITIDSPDSGDDFGPGDTIKIEVNVANSAASDKDVVVKAVLYDVDTNKKVDDVSSDDEEIEADEDLDFELELDLPMDGDEDWKGDYAIYVMAYEDGKEDEQCIMDVVSVDVGRESDRVIIEDLTVNPTSVDAGDSVDILVDVLNIGKDDQEEVYVKIQNSELGIDLKSDVISLDEYDGGNIAHVFRFANVEVSGSVAGGNYQLSAEVVFDGKSTKFTASPTYRATDAKNVLTVKGAVIDGIVELEELEQATDNSYSVPVTVTNTGDAGEFTIDLAGEEDFAEEVTPKTAYLASGASKKMYFTLDLLEEVEPEEYVVDVVMRSASGELVNRESFSVDLSEGVSTGGWLSSKTFWIIGDIVLIVVAIFFLKLIFGGRKPEVQEVKL